MKYSFKEKRKHYSDLLNPTAALADLALLIQKQPGLPELKKYARNPLRYAHDILYRLLDFVERDEIRKFRRENLEKKNPEASAPDPEETPSPGTSSEAEQTLQPADDDKGANENPETNAPHPDEVERIRREIAEVEQRANEAEEALEETEASLEEEQDARTEAEERAEEAEQRAEEAEAALEEEKKKEQKPVKEKSKKTKNTPTSTGTTSSTPTSS
jgi:predicted ribosome quality control (RQC) complex YloA/Tae2 family protein